MFIFYRSCCRHFSMATIQVENDIFIAKLCVDVYMYSPASLLKIYLVYNVRQLLIFLSTRCTLDLFDQGLEIYQQP